MLPTLTFAAVLLAVTALADAGSGRLNVPQSIVLVLTGASLSFVPGLRPVAIEPDFVLLLLLPPLLYSAGVGMSWRGFRCNMRPILLLAIGCVLFTATAVAAACHYLLGMDWAVGFVLGAVVAPPDAVAPMAIARRLHMPQRLLIILEGEGLVNDATALILFTFAVGAVSSGGVSVSAALAGFAAIIVGELAWGIAVAWVLLRVISHSLLNKPIISVTLSNETPTCIAETPIHMKPQFTIHRTLKQRSESLPLHAHEEGQLTFAASGIVQVHTNEGIWLVPPQLAGWTPSGVSHRIEAMTDVELWIVQWQPAAIRAWGNQIVLDRAFALRISPLLRCLLTEAVSIDPMSDKAELLARLMLPELNAMQDAPTFPPLPTSPVGRRVADLILADYRNLKDLDDLASPAATSVRTVSRLFPEETGLTLKAWRQRARIVRTMEQLAQGNAPAKVAQENDFSSTAAFSCAFRQVTAMTPTAFLGPSAQSL
jgi:AraC-like DNA-binding protein/mannose-6-phosphate isomerase-like protein (cupin superfamily)